MIRENVIVIGSSGHSKVIIDIFEKEGKYQILGLIDSFRNIGEQTMGYKVIGKEDDLPGLLIAHPGCKVFIAIGDNWVRQVVMDKAVGLIPAISFASTIHPSAQIGRGVTIGRGVAVMPGAIVNSDSSIGDFVIINTGASIDHDCTMEKFSSLAPGVAVGGKVTIGAYSSIAIGATVINGLIIGKHCVVGAGAVLLKHCEDNAMMYGVPAQKIKSREIGDKYL